MLPIASVGDAGRCFHLQKGLWLAFLGPGDPVLDAVGKTAVELQTEGSVAPFAEAGSSVELEEIDVNLLRGLHLHVIQLFFSLHDRIDGAEVLLEFVNKVVQVRHSRL